MQDINKTNDPVSSINLWQLKEKQKRPLLLIKRNSRDYPKVIHTNPKKQKQNQLQKDIYCNFKNFNMNWYEMIWNN